jgi:hypothetical protein
MLTREVIKYAVANGLKHGMSKDEVVADMIQLDNLAAKWRMMLALPSLPCEGCGKPFTKSTHPKVRGQRYCSRQCAARHGHRRRRWSAARATARTPGSATGLPAPPNPCFLGGPE